MLQKRKSFRLFPSPLRPLVLSFFLAPPLLSFLSFFFSSPVWSRSFFFYFASSLFPYSCFILFFPLLTLISHSQHDLTHSHSHIHITHGQIPGTHTLPPKRIKTRLISTCAVKHTHARTPYSPLTFSLLHFLCSRWQKIEKLGEGMLAHFYFGTLLTLRQKILSKHECFARARKKTSGFSIRMTMTPATSLNLSPRLPRSAKHQSCKRTPSRSSGMNGVSWITLPSWSHNTQCQGHVDSYSLLGGEVFWMRHLRADPEDEITKKKHLNPCSWLFSFPPCSLLYPFFQTMELLEIFFSLVDTRLFTDPPFD